ncbi:MAG: hypothetical protein DWP92_09560 [Armatimonadetes bacterium]|nr:MAG: hypothetical protein DWP92_09560 [Armatimonadota bacterium]
MIATGILVIYLATQASDTSADAELLMDGVDRSRLPRDEAVALALLAHERSAPIPASESHDHGHDNAGHGHEMTAEEQAAFDAQWKAATEAIERYDTLEEIEAAGYVLASAVNDGVGAHYVKWSIVDRPFDPAEPSMLLFDTLVWGEDPELVAYSYWVTSDERPEGFVGEEDSWHRHLGVCFVNGMIGEEGIVREDCPGDWVNGMDMWMLHAWVVPGVENRYGRFHTANPLLCEHACGLEN